MSERLDAVQERLDAVKLHMKLETVNDPVALYAALPIPTHNSRAGLALFKLIGILANQGIELQGGKYHKDLPEQTLDVVKELASLVENAVEEYLDAE